MGGMPCSFDGCNVLGICAAMQNSAVHFRMKRLYASIQHFGKTGQIGDVFHCDAGIAQEFCRAAGGDQFDTLRREFAGEIHKSGFVGDTENGALNLAGMRALSEQVAEWRPKILPARFVTRHEGHKKRRTKERWRRQGGLRGALGYFAFAFSLTCPSVSSTEYSTLSHLYCLRICSVFF